MKICGTVVRPPARALMALRLCESPATSISSKAAPFCVNSLLAAMQ
jgi:hypothetical protein